MCSKWAHFSVIDSKRNKSIPTSYNNFIVNHIIFLVLCTGFLFLHKPPYFHRRKSSLSFNGKMWLHLEDIISGCSSLVKCKVLLLYLTNSIILTLSICKYLSYPELLEFYKIRNRNGRFKTVNFRSSGFLCKLYQSSKYKSKLLYKKLCIITVNLLNKVSLPREKTSS